MSKKKEYIFINRILTTEEISVMANSYEEAEGIFLHGGGKTEEVHTSDSVDWDCIQNADDFEENGEE
jgi:hypothetical protein